MKKIILLLTIAIIGNLAIAQTLSRTQLRENFLRATQSRAALDSLNRLLDRAAVRNPTEECYLGMCNALQIQYTDGMWKKYKVLDQSRDHVAKAIRQAPQDAELRFLRFMLEHNIPSFLGMSTHIHDDLAFIFRTSAFMDQDVDMKKMVVQFILDSKRCTTEQVAKLQNELSELKKKQYAER